MLFLCCHWGVGVWHEKGRTEFSKNLNNEFTLELNRNRGVMGSCLLSIFCSGTDSGHLEESENHYPGQLVKSAHCIGYHCGVPHRETEWWGRRWRRREVKREGRGITDKISCEKRRNWDSHKFSVPSSRDVSVTVSSPCHSCRCVWFQRNKGILSEWCNSERPYLHGCLAHHFLHATTD